MKQPFHQKLILWIIGILAGITALGALLDAFSNAETLITPPVTYSATAIVLLGWLTTELYIRWRGIHWVTKDNQKVRLRKPGSIIRLALLGVLLLLWYPRALDLFRRPEQSAQVPAAAEVPSATTPIAATDTPTPTVAAAPTLGITPTNTPTLAYEAQWRGDYYNNEELSGNPVATREDAALNFHWDGQEPITGVSWEHWSARWTATLCFEKGPVTFYLRYDDSAKLYVDGVLIEDTTDNPSNETWIPYEASGCNEIVVEYRQGTGGSYLKVGWYQ